MNYIDTNVIIAYLNEKDVNHSRALKVLDKSERTITSPIALLELRSVFSRTTNFEVDEIEAFVDYLPEINLEVPEVDMNTIFNHASEIATKIRLRTLDILHLSASAILNASDFVTFDSEFKEKEIEIAGFGLRIISG